MEQERFKHYTLGIDAIDHQHKELFNSINIIAELHDKNKLTIETFSILQTQLIKHFREEEILMNSVGYPYVMSHIDRHKHLESKMTEFIDRFNMTIDKRSIINFLEKMIIIHIDNTDRNFSDWCKDNDACRVSLAGKTIVS